MAATAPGVLFTHIASHKSREQGGVKEEAHCPCISLFIPRSPQSPHPLSKSHWPEELSHMLIPYSSLAKETTSPVTAIEILWLVPWGSTHYLPILFFFLSLYSLFSQFWWQKRRNDFLKATNGVYHVRFLYSTTSESFCMWMCTVCVKRQN